jgi:hypothetical protein
MYLCDSVKQKSGTGGDIFFHIQLTLLKQIAGAGGNSKPATEDRNCVFSAVVLFFYLSIELFIELYLFEQTLQPTLIIGDNSGMYLKVQHL